MNKKMFFFDTETGGLDAKRNPILQLSWIIEVDGEIVNERCYDIKPHDNAEFNLKALEVNGFSIDRMMKGTAAGVVLLQMQSDIKAAVGGGSSLIPCGHRVSFDIDMLAALAQLGSEKYWLNFGHNDYVSLRTPVCTLGLCHYLNCTGVLKLSDYKLSTVCKALDIPIVNAHDALADVRATRLLFHKLHSIISGV